MRLKTTGLTSPYYSGYSRISDFAINARGHIFAAGGDVFRSTDIGNSWTSGGLRGATDLAINPTNGYIFAVTGIRGGIFRSEDDNGDRWYEIDSGLEGKNISGLAISPNGYIFVYADQIYRSTNNGNTWSPVLVGGSKLFAINSSGSFLL